MTKNLFFYQTAIEYLNGIKPDSVTDLEKYFIGDRRDYSSLKDVYIQFIQSAQNYQRMPNVIKLKERYDRISELLEGFDYTKVKDKDIEELYQQFRKEFDVGGANNKYNCWHKWSGSVVDSAKFISDFSDVDDFREFVKCFDYNVSTRMALPLFISEKITGIGFALACDLLKELGFTTYPKPDVHLIEVFSELGLAEKNPISTFEAIVRMSDECKEVDINATPYKVDKVIWLICSGRYYLEAPEVQIARHKKQFIEHCKSVM